MYEKMMQESVGKHSPFIRDKLRISLTNQCNRHCFYCHNEGQGHNHTPVFLRLETVEALTDYCKRGGYRLKKVNLTGGEPLLHPQLDDVITTISAITDSIRLNTNATLLTEEWIDRLIELGVDEFKIGVDSFSSEDNCSEIKEENRCRISKIVRHIKKAGGRVVINMVVTDGNQHLIDKMIEICRAMGVSHLKIIEQVDFNFYRKEGYQTKTHPAFFRAYDRYRKQCVDFIPDVDAGMDDMVLENGFRIRWCESFCRSRACGTMYSILNAEGAIVTCSKSEEQCVIDFSPTRSVSEIDEDICNAQNSICNVSERRYLRDMNGVRVPDGLSQRRLWNWETEEKGCWQKPEPIVYALSERWRKKGSRLLDIGCGLGRNAFAFEQAGFCTFAIDNSAYAIERVAAKNDSGVTALKMDMSRLMFPNASFDCIFSFNSLSHADDYLLMLAIKEIYRVLRPEGEAWLTLCSKEAPAWRDTGAPLIAEHTKLKQKQGSEFGVAHYYADLNDILWIFRMFTILDIRHVDHCYYENGVHESRHYEILLQKPNDPEYRAALRSFGA